MQPNPISVFGPDPDEFFRLPGLFRRWEIEQVIDAASDFHIEQAGTTEDGTQLFAIYRQEHYHSGGRR